MKTKQNKIGFLELLRKKLNRNNVAWMVAAVVIMGVVPLLDSVPIAGRGNTANQTLVQTNDSFVTAVAKEILEEGEQEIFGQTYQYQVIRAELANGPDKGKEVEIRNENSARRKRRPSRNGRGNRGCHYRTGW